MSIKVNTVGLDVLGSDPGSPLDGDMWARATGLKYKRGPKVVTSTDFVTDVVDPTVTPEEEIQEKLELNLYVCLKKDLLFILTRKNSVTTTEFLVYAQYIKIGLSKTLY